MDIQKRLGENLKRLRKRSGRSQEEFAHDAGLHRTYISDVERGARNPTITVVEKMAKALEVSFDDLLT
ncbi:MAG: helix-turn-helix domain-containing protein [Sphingomonas sp.]